MADNPYVNKVQKADGTVIMDISEDTATPNDVLNGATFHDRSGTPQTGAVITHNVYDGLDSISSTDALSANQGKVINDKISVINNKVAPYTGTGTLGQNGRGTIDDYIPSTWTFNIGFTPVAGDIITIKAPVDGVNSGVWISVDDGTTYYPIAVIDKQMLTRQYPANSILMLMYETNATTKTYGSTTSGLPAGSIPSELVSNRWILVNGHFDMKNIYVTSINDLKNVVPEYTNEVTFVHCSGAVTNTLFGAANHQSMLACFDYGTGYIEITGIDTYSNLYGCSLKRSDNTIEDRKTYCKSRIKRVIVTKSLTISSDGGYTEVCSISDVASDCTTDKIIAVGIASYSGSGFRVASFSSGKIYVSSNIAITNKSTSIYITYDADGYMETSSKTLS